MHMNLREVLKKDIRGILVDESGESTKGLCYQIIKKHRDGELRKIKHQLIFVCNKLF